MKITARERQSLFDLALAATGSVEGAFEIAVAWGHPLSDEPADGTVLESPGEGDDPVSVKYAAAGIVPATGLDGDDGAVCGEGGIGSMCVETDFRIE